MFPRLHPRARAAQHQAQVEARQSVSPLTLALAKVTALLRLDLSTPASGEWSSVTDERNGANPAVQTDTDRRTAVGTANGRPTMVFDGTDVLSWLTAVGNNPTANLELMLWIKPTVGIVSRQRILHIGSPSNLNKLTVDIAAGKFEIQYFLNQTAGRLLTTSVGPTAATWQHLRVKFASNGAADADKMAAFKDGANLGGSFTNIGVGGAMTALQAAAGGFACLIGGATDSDTPSSPLLAGVEIGCAIAIASQELTDAEALAMSGFLSPVDPLIRSVVTDGNSITFGSGAAGGSSYPDQLGALFYDQDIVVTNVGIAGKTTQQLINDFPTKVLPLYRTNAELVFFEQYNSFNQGSSVEAEKALVQTYVAQARAAGFRVWICTPPPTSDTAINDKIVDYSAWLRLNNGFANGFIDVNACPEFTPPGSVANPTYYFDSAHMTAAGYGVLAAKVYAALTA